MPVRNENVERSVSLIIGLLDRLSDGESLGKPAPRQIKALFDEHIEAHGGSVRLACVFLSAYAIVDSAWDFKSVPTGIRGQYGDKRLASELTFRHVTLHKNITAFGENLGWKGAVRQFDLSQDARFAPFLAEVKKLTVGQREILLNHISWRLYASRVVPQVLPPLPSSYLSYGRSLDLCERLLVVPSEGHIQQFLVAAFLEVHRRRFGHRISTHHPHAADRFDGTVGDIEEFRDSELVAAYEVTVRNDWKNRLADFGKKGLKGNLPKYVIFAAGVRGDLELRPASRLIEFGGQLSFDLAVVDLLDFFSVFCAELSRDEISQAFNRTYQLLSDPRLSGREDILSLYRAVANEWMEG
jgi:hypothetical protein